jgi:hypothetical protein
MTSRTFVTETELRDFVGYYAERRYWHRADRRTRERWPQALALRLGWIEPLPPGSVPRRRHCGRSGVVRRTNSV